MARLLNVIAIIAVIGVLFSAGGINDSTEGSTPLTCLYNTMLNPSQNFGSCTLLTQLFTILAAFGAVVSLGAVAATAGFITIATISPERSKFVAKAAFAATVLTFFIPDLYNTFRSTVEKMYFFGDASAKVIAGLLIGTIIILSALATIEWWSESSV